MVGSRSRSDRATFDIFHCLRCDTIIRIDSPRDETGREQD
jgi:RNase P subunit RPR2